MKTPLLTLHAEYATCLAELKERIRGTRQRALLAVNGEQIQLYHDIGGEILSRQNQHGWGAKVIDRLSGDLSVAFPQMKGFSSRNLKYMKAFCVGKPIGIAEYPLVRALPEPLDVSLPTIEEIEDALSRDLGHEMTGADALRQDSACAESPSP